MMQLFQAPDTGQPQGPSKDTASEPGSAAVPPIKRGWPDEPQEKADGWAPWPNSYNPNNTTQLG